MLVMSLIGKTANERKDMVGLSSVAEMIMFRSVLGYTPASCSSIKLADVSNPEMPNMAEENP